MQHQGYQPHIDGLRAVAIVLVVAYHAEIPGLSGGFIGVDIFFVISGYLILGLLTTELARTGRIRWGAFFARRVRRLVPAAVLMTAVVLGLSMLLLDPFGERQGAAKAGIAGLFSVSNIFFWKVAPVDYFTVGSSVQPFLHTWSLSVEEQFYAVLPVVIGLLSVVCRWRAWSLRRVLPVALIVASALSLGVAVWAAQATPSAGFYLLPARAYEFGLGGAIALFAPVIRNRRLNSCLGFAGWALLGLCLAFPLPEEGFPSAWGLLPVGVAAAIIIAGRGDPSESSVLCRPAVVQLGRWSYGWYLWHWPLLALASAVNLGPVSPVVGSVVVLLALVLAVMSFHLVEEPVRHRVTVMTGSGALRPVPVLVAGCLLLGGTAAAGAAVGLEAEDAQLEAYWVAVGDGRDDMPVLPHECLPDDDQPMASPGSRCEVYAAGPSRPTVVLWGDSHAWHLIPAVREAAVAGDLNLVAWVGGGCPAFVATELPSEPTGVDASGQEFYTKCVDHNRAALRDVRAMAADVPVRVVIGGRWPFHLGEDPISLIERSTLRDDAEFVSQHFRLTEGLPALVGDLATLGVAVDLVGPVPELERSAPDCVNQSMLGVSCDVSIEREQAYQSQSFHLLRAALRLGLSGSRLVDLRPVLCPNELCLAQSAGMLNYFDDDHLSATRALAFAPFFDVTIAAISG